MAKRRIARGNFPGTKGPVGFTPRPGAGFGESWAPKVGEHVTGKIMEHRTKVGPNEQEIVKVRTSGGDVTVWLSANLLGRLTKRDVGKLVYIQRTADVKHKRKGYSPIKTYFVGVK